MKNQQIADLSRTIAVGVFLILTLIVFGVALDPVLRINPNPLFVIFLETHDLLGLLLVVYLAHRLSPTVAIALAICLPALHIPYLLMGYSMTSSEITRQVIFLVASFAGIRIIVTRNQFQEKLIKTAAELEARQTAAFNRAEELVILNGIATVGVEATSVDTLIEDATQIIDSALHPDYFDVGMVDEKNNTIQIYRSRRTWDGGVFTIPLNQGIAGQVVASGKASRVPNVRLEPTYLAMSSEVQSELCVPLKMGKKVIGVINVESKQLNAFSDDDEQLLTTFAEQLVTAIQKVRLFQSEQRHARESEILREAGAIVAATLSQEETIERILVQLKRVIPYDSASVQLLGDGYMEIVGGRGWADPKSVVGLRFPIPGDNPNTVVVQQRGPYLLGDAPSAFQAFRAGPHSHIFSFLGVPLIVRSQVIGMLAIDSTKPNFFDEGHVRLVMAFADQVALAIQNARLFSEVQQLAHTDGLTGLHNRRHLMELAAHEFRRAQRYHHGLASIMLDIDHFKTVNDTYGHAIGDQVLQTVAARCTNCVRKVDVLGRYGGEEFVLILLETDLDGAMVVGQRLCRSIADPPIETERGPLTVTVSIGVAVLDDDCKDLDGLLQRADEALYAAKQAGRNQVAAWKA